MAENGFTNEDRETLIRLDERMNNHLKHHERAEAKLNKWLIALTICLIGLAGKVILAWVL